jgi:hypothetical protein
LFYKEQIVFIIDRNQDNGPSMIDDFKFCFATIWRSQMVAPDAEGASI